MAHPQDDEPQDEDAKFFETIRVDVTLRVFTGTNVLETTEDWTVTASSFQEMARKARGETGTRCILSMRTPEDGATFTRREHFVPNGFGYGWTAPGRGVGTCDEMNAAFGRFEGEWLRYGKMGFFRPLFVAKGKKNPPAYYAPSMKSPKIWVVREEGTLRRLLCFSEDVRHNLPERGGPADLVIRVAHMQARVEWVSLALHKMALLMLWLCKGSLAVDPAFDDVRRFLVSPGAATYRPFVETFESGACPGVELRYFVALRPIGDGLAGLDSVLCAMKIHHMQYRVMLAGSYPSTMPWTPWVDPRAPVADHTPFAFHFDGIERRPVK
jgi:hypothetical protein